MRIGIVGMGNMGSAMIAGLLKDEALLASVVAYDKVSSQSALQSDRLAIAHPQTWKSLGKFDCIIMAVKPADMSSALAQVAEFLGDDAVAPLWISIAAGITMATLKGSLPSGARICRVMPNTPATIGAGISAFCLSENHGPLDQALAESVLNTLGKTVVVAESMMNAVTGLSGSGPAYVFLFIEALIEGGVLAGLPAPVARQLALQTVLGSAQMAAASTDSPDVLKSKVMSPGGTTVHGIMALEENKFKFSVMKAVAAATNRAGELGK